MEIDDRVTLPGAEGIDHDLVLAGIGSRGIALLIDSLILTISLLLLLGLAQSMGEIGATVFYIGAFVIGFGYPIGFEAFNGGRTVGKMAMGLAVVRTDGTPVTFLAALVRNVARVVDVLPGAYFVGVISMLATSRVQRLGDLAAGTLVVRTRGSAVLPMEGWDSPWHSTDATGAPMLMPAEIAAWDTSSVTVDEVAAVRAYLGRRAQLAPEHRYQIADRLARQLLPKVAGIPLDGGPDLFLERVAYARSFR